MQSLKGFRLRWPARRSARTLPYDVAEAVLIVALAAAAVALFWTLVKPMRPVGRWQAVGSSISAADPSILTRFDPFFRSAPVAGTAAVTSLPLKLFGVRLDQAMGRGSAIIATPDGLQNSFAVGDEIVPGVTLKAVAIDSVTIERGGASEQLFLDQSAGATTPATGDPASGVAPQAGAVQPVPMQAAPPPVQAPPISPQGLLSGVSFAPRMEKGAVTGFVVGPKGAGNIFASTGLKQGDVVTQINGVGIRSVEDAASAMGSAARPGQTIFTVDRGGTIVTVSSGAAK